jgi:homocysteine S-methyltransferase
VPPETELRREWGDQVAVLAEAGADLILIESMYAIFQLRPAGEVARATGLPVFLGIQALPGGTLESGETAADLAAALKGREVDAILPMCSWPESISAMLPQLRAAYSGAIGGYANLGYGFSKAPLDVPGRQYHSINVRYSPVDYARFAQEWLEMGAQIVGGCCASTPEHIALLRPLVK